LIGLTSLWIDGRTLVPPELNRKRALVVLEKIDEILAWEQTKERERDQRFVELGQHLCEVRAGQYWRLENLKSFDEFLEKRFPASRRKAYYLLAIHEHLTRIPKQQLRDVGWTKARELVKVARREGIEFDCAPWVHKAKELPREDFKREVERYLTGKETEAWEIIYFKLYKSQLPVVERALEIAALMLGSDKSRGYSLEMICADFLAGAALEKEESEQDRGSSASRGVSFAASQHGASTEESAT
jgi:hypothetical protein